LGFRLEITSPSSVEIHAVPSDVQPGNEEATLESMMQSLEDIGRLPRERRREGVAAVYAAKQAMRRGERLTSPEMRSLVKDLFSCAVPHVTPQGEPTYIVIPFDELVQRFQ
jgi:DNA mismatch repair protein MutL